MTKKRIVVVGSINMDLVCSTPRIPVPGETILGENFQVFLGGKGANQAVGVARLGYPVAMVGKLGDDEFAVRLRRELEGAGVSVEAVGTARGTPTGMALISVDRKGQNSIIVVPGANGKLCPSDVERVVPLLRSAAVIMAQLETPLNTIQRLAEIAHELRVPLMLDPAPACALPAGLLRKVTYLTPNETETLALCRQNGKVLNRSSAAQYARALRRRGPETVIVKMGRYGAYLSAPPNIDKFIPAFKVKAVDSTAAGDAFNAGLAVGLLRGESIGQACQFACAVGALSVTKMGAQSSMPTGKEVNSFLRN